MNDHGQEHDTLASSSSSSCQSDMIELERNTDLSDSLQSALNSFSSDFNANPLEYCHSSTSSNTISSSAGRGERNLDCFVDFEVFSSEYKSICRYNEAEHFPVTIFMQCSSMSTNVNLEMELANIPTCLAHRCDRVEVGIALDRLLSESNEQPSSSSSTNGGGGGGGSGTFGGFSCTMYKKVNHYNQVSSSATSISNLGAATATATIFFGVLNLMLLGI